MSGWQAGPRWLQARFTTGGVVGEYLGEDGGLWDSSGQLVDTGAEDDIARSDWAPASVP
jgi:hypothetical protein